MLTLPWGSILCPMEAIAIDPGDARAATLCALRDETLATGRVPSLRDLASAQGLSVPGIKKQLDWLERNGLISRIKHQPRSAVLTDAGRRAAKNWLLRQSRRAA